MPYIIAGVFSLLISGYYYHNTQPVLSKSRRFLLFSLRSLSVFVILLLLISPIMYFIGKQKDTPQVLFLSDRSISMNLHTSGVTKKDFQKPLVEQLEKAFKAVGYSVLDFSFANGLDKDNGTTLLNKALEELSAKVDFSKVETIVLSSDGWLRDENFNIVNRLGIPILAIADSTSTSVSDLAVLGIQANRYAYRKEPTLIRARVKSTNYSGNAEVSLYLGKTKLQTQIVRLEADTEKSVDFTYRFDNTGFFNYSVQVKALEKEQRLGNNSYPNAIEVLAEKERILVFSDSPAWDNKFILDAIATNSRWESVSYLVRDGNLFIGEKPVSINVEDNAAVIVLVNNSSLRLGRETLEYIKTAQKRGTGLLFQGKPRDELNEVIPINKSNINTSYQGFLQLKNNAGSYSMLAPLLDEIRELPPLDYYYVTADAGSDVVGTINNTQSSPGLVVYDVGNSRSIAFAFLNLWRWQMQSKNSSYQKLVVNCLTWLSNKALGAYSPIYQSSYLRGEEIVIRLRAEDDIRSADLDKNPQIVIYDSSGKELMSDFMIRSNDEYVYNASLDEAGDYRFEIKEQDSKQKATGQFSLSEASAEERDFDYNLPLLAYLTSQSRGKILYPKDVAAFNPIPPMIQERTIRNEYALYKKWYILALFILSFCIELLFRRRWGLL